MAKKKLKKQYGLYITEEAAEAIIALAKELGIKGERGSSFSATIDWIGRTASGAMAETVAALNIASGCAAGENWDELIEAIEPKNQEA